MSVAISRLAEERKNWRKNHPFGFTAKPRTNEDGSSNMFIWDCKVPGKEGTIWEGGLYPVTVQFGNEYPAAPPSVAFPQGFKHPNVFTTGHVCLSIIGKGWRPSVSVKEILLGLQELLSDPNKLDPANHEVNTIYVKEPKKYQQLVKAQVEKYTPKE